MLDNSRLSPEIESSLRSTPYDTKISIFDKKCSRCGWCFMRVRELPNKANGEIENIYEFASYDDFIDFINTFSFKKNIIVERGCLFRTDVIGRLESREAYWTVDEVITNTCSLWYEKPNEQEPQQQESFQEWYENGAIIAPDGTNLVPAYLPEAESGTVLL